MQQPYWSIIDSIHRHQESRVLQHSNTTSHSNSRCSDVVAVLARLLVLVRLLWRQGACTKYRFSKRDGDRCSIRINILWLFEQDLRHLRNQGHGWRPQSEISSRTVYGPLQNDDFPQTDGSDTKVWFSSCIRGKCSTIAACTAVSSQKHDVSLTDDSKASLNSFVHRPLIYV